MDRLHIVLLGPDPLTQAVVGSGLQTYGYDVGLARTEFDALHQLQRTGSSILVADVDYDTAARLDFARAAREADDSLTVIYTTRTPSRLSTCAEVAGAPCLRTPYDPHQLVSLIRQLFPQNGSSGDSCAA